MERVKEKEKEFRFKTHGPKYMMRGPNLEWGIILLRPNDTLGKHMHEKVEEIFFFLEGSPLMEVAGDRFIVEPNEAVRISPKEPHDIINNTKENVKVIFIKSPYLPEDKISIQ
jgi:mannose-6-phosphate isomerase-like protein (cupin superfamily)